MAVLIEAISVVIRLDSINARFPGGWPGFVENVPNSTLCFDTEISRVGFMSPEDVKAYVDQLELSGLRYLIDGQAQDIAVIDQLAGFLVSASWLELASLYLDEFGGSVQACRLCGSQVEKLVVPGRWSYAGSMSQTKGFKSAEARQQDLEFVRTDGGVDVYFDKITGKEVYLGRTSRSH